MDSKRLSILIVTAWYPTKKNPTLGLFIKEQAVVLAREHDVTLLAVLRTSRWKRAVYHEGNLSVIVVESPLIAMTTKGKLRKWATIATREVAILEEQEPIQVIHLHDVHPIIASDDIRRVSSAALVATVHNSDVARGSLSHYYADRLKSGLLHCQATIAVGVELQRVMVEKYASACTQVIPNVVDTERFVLSDQRHRNGTVEILLTASLTKVKRVAPVIVAMTMVSNDGLRLHIAGDGPLKQELTELIVQLGLEDRVRLHGVVGRSDLATIAGRCTLSVSNSEVETFGIAAMEGLSAGLPLVYSRSGLELLVPEYAGIATDGSSEQIAAAIDRIINDYQDYDRDRIRQHVVQRYSPDVILGQLTALYLQQINSH